MADRHLLAELVRTALRDALDDMRSPRARPGSASRAEAYRRARSRANRDDADQPFVVTLQARLDLGLQAAQLGPVRLNDLRDLLVATSTQMAIRSTLVDRIAAALDGDPELGGEAGGV